MCNVYLIYIQLTECKIPYWSQTEFDKAICHGLEAEFRCTQFTFSDWKINKMAGRLQTAINTETYKYKTWLADHT